MCRISTPMATTHLARTPISLLCTYPQCSMSAMQGGFNRSWLTARWGVYAAK